MDLGSPSCPQVSKAPPFAKNLAALQGAEPGPATVDMRAGCGFRAGLVAHYGVRVPRQCHGDLGVDWRRVRAHGVQHHVAQHGVTVEPVDDRVVAVDDPGRFLVDERLGTRGHSAWHGLFEDDEAIALEIALFVLGEPSRRAIQALDVGHRLSSTSQA